VEVLGLLPAPRDHVHVDVDRHVLDRQSLDSALLERLAQRDVREVRVPVAMPAELQPSPSFL
jgi:hypothetical protein